MNQRDKYQRVEILRNENEQSNDCSEGQVGFYDEEVILDHEDKFAPPSPTSSIPPNDFDVNFEAQYVPIYGEDDLQDGGGYISSSLASSLSVDSNRDRTTPPVLIITNTCRLIRCPVCEKPMRTFYCAKCIQRGQFVTIDKPTSDNFSETNLNALDLLTESEENLPEEKILEETLQIKSRALSKKIEALKSLYDNQNQKLKETQELLNETREQVELEKKSIKSKENKIVIMNRLIAHHKNSVKDRRNLGLELAEDLKQYVHRRVYQLTNDIFPIEQVNLLEQNNSFINMETSPLLTFSDGSHHQIEQQTAYSIVEPWLPGDGDYSAYSLWVNDNQHHIPASMSDLSERNPAFRIGAALAYTAQLVQNLASYMDVILPAKIDLNMFNRELLNDPQFTYNVAKLNTNVIHLCISQGIDTSLLNPQRTLRNLMLLFNINVSDLGRKPIIEFDNEEIASKIESRLMNDLSLIQEDFYDFSKFIDVDDISDSEWEISDNINSAEMQMAISQSIQQNSYIARLSLGRLLTSLWGASS